MKKIRDCIAQNDASLFTIHVHAMKSAAASIGAGKVSELFEALEMASARGDAVFIHENTKYALEELETLLKKIHAVLTVKQEEPAKETDPEYIKKELMRLREALEDRDAGKIDDIIGILKAVEWNRHAADIVKEISRDILLIDYTGAAALVDKLSAVF